MYDYQYISPSVWDFVQAQICLRRYARITVRRVYVGMQGGGLGDLAYGLAMECIKRKNRNVFICKLAIPGCSVSALEGTHWKNGVGIDSATGALYTAMATLLAPVLHWRR
ncbi:MAG: hypothetical protein R3E64_04065 [Halioglobus sp.]